VTQIDISYQDTIIKSYDFSHSISPDSGRSLLTSYDVIGYEDSGDTVRAGETVFTYSESNLQFERDEDFPALLIGKTQEMRDISRISGMHLIRCGKDLKIQISHMLRGLIFETKG